MVRHLEEWECTTCGKKYDSEIAATACEAVVPATYPIGCMYATYMGTIDDTYAVATNRVNGHRNEGGSWWSRDEDVGTKFIGHKNTCINGSGELQLGRRDRHVDLELPSCRRLIEWLESQGITPTVWDGKKAISLDEARANPKPRWRYDTGFGTHPRRRF